MYVLWLVAAMLKRSENQFFLGKETVMHRIYERFKLKLNYLRDSASQSDAENVEEMS